MTAAPAAPAATVEIITDPRRLLLDRNPQPYTGPILIPLSAAEEHLLVFAYTYLRDHPQLEDGRWFPVAQHSRANADALVLTGYFVKHPSGRRKMWYGVTEDGEARARAALDTAQSGCAAWSWKPHTAIEADRLESLERLIRDLAQQGFVPMPEAGRGPQYGEVAFYNVFSRQIELWRCRIGAAKWYRYDLPYFRPDPVLASAQQAAYDRAMAF